MEDNKTNKIQECILRKVDWTTLSLNERFDKSTFDPKKMLDVIPTKSPRIVTLLDKILELDKKDMSKRKNYYKHFIFSSTKGTSKILASALISLGFINVIGVKNGSITLDYEKLKINNPYKFALLSSTSLYDKPSSLVDKKNILRVFNSDLNNYGQLCRFIILDEGFLEGIDLMDMRYCHLFDEPLNMTILEQAIGRGKRYCSHKDLPYGNKGWELNVYIYSNELKVKSSSKTLDLNAYLKHYYGNKKQVFMDNFKHSLLELMKESAFDRSLTKNLFEEKLETKIQKEETVKNKHVLEKIGIIAASGLATYGVYRFLKPRLFSKKKD